MNSIFQAVYTGFSTLCWGGLDSLESLGALAVGTKGGEFGMFVAASFTGRGDGEETCKGILEGDRGLAAAPGIQGPCLGALWSITDHVDGAVFMEVFGTAEEDFGTGKTRRGRHCWKERKAGGKEGSEGRIVCWRGDKEMEKAVCGFQFFPTSNQRNEVK